MTQLISYKKFVDYEGFRYFDNFLVLKNMRLLAEYMLKYAWSPCIWRDGKREKENFLEAHFLVLDFDQPGEETLEEINHSLQDHKRIIATTRNHQKLKKGVLCDRFRLVIPFDRPLTTLADYEYNMQLALKKWPWVDKSALDGGRFFFPSNKILYFDNSAIYSWETSTTPTSYLDTLTTLKTKINMNVNGKIPDWCLGFINNGWLGRDGSRHVRVYAVAFELFKQGFVEDDVVRLIRRAPIDWQGVNWRASVENARRKVLNARENVERSGENHFSSVHTGHVSSSQDTVPF